MSIEVEAIAFSLKLMIGLQSLNFVFLSFSFQTSNQLTNGSWAWKSGGGSVLLKVTNLSQCSWTLLAKQLWKGKNKKKEKIKTSHSLSKLSSTKKQKQNSAKFQEQKQK